MRWFGPDIFISYRIAEARQYARSLRDQLERRGFRCFLDEHWQRPGDNIRAYQKAATRSRMFVLIGTSTVLDSEHIPLEIAAYHRAHNGWFSRRWNRIFPISVAGALAKFERAETSAKFLNTDWAPLIGLVAEGESDAVLFSGKPSERMVDRIAATYGLLRGTILLLGSTLVVSLLVVAATIGVIRWSVRRATLELGKARSELGVVNSEYEKAKRDLKDAGENLKTLKGLADAESKRADEQRRVADGFNLVNRATRLSEHDEDGSPNTERALLAIISWKTNPKPGAFELMSQSLIRLTLPVRRWGTQTHPINLIAVDPAGKQFVVSDGKDIAVWSRSGSVIQPRLPAEEGQSVRGLAFADSGKELVVLTSTGFRRLRTDDWSLIKPTAFGKEVSPTISPDGEWVAYQDEDTVILIETTHPGGKTSFPGKLACFSTTLGLKELEILEANETSSNLRIHSLLKENAPPDTFQNIDSQAAVNIRFSAAFASACGGGWFVTPNPQLGEAIIVSSAFGGTTGQTLHWASGGVVMNTAATQIIAGNDSLSHLWTPGPNGWMLRSYLPAANSFAFGPRDEVVTADNEGVVTVSKTSDPRLLWDSSVGPIPASILRSFEGDWAQVELLESVLGHPLLQRSANKKWALDLPEGLVAVVDSASGIAVLEVERRDVTEASFSRDGKSVALRSPTNTRVWSLDPDYYVRSLCERLKAVYDTGVLGEWHPDHFRAACGPARFRALADFAVNDQHQPQIVHPLIKLNRKQ